MRYCNHEYSRAFVAAAIWFGFTPVSGVQANQVVSPQDTGRQELVWPDLPPSFRPGYAADAKQLHSLKMGDKVPIPESGSFRVITVDMPWKDDVLGIKDFTGIINSLDGTKLTVTVKDPLR